MKIPGVVVALSLSCASGFASNAIDNIGAVKLKGYLGERLESMIQNHVVARDTEYITAPFMEKTETKYWWQTEFWGKWMHSAVPYLRYMASSSTPPPAAAALDRKISDSVRRLLSSQEKNGYIGNYPEALRCGEGWDVWGMKYTMMGLIHYYDYQSEFGNKKEAASALAACSRLCDYVMSELGPGGKRGVALWQTGNWSGYASSSILEPVMWLYNRTKNEKYFDFASYIVKGMSEPEAGPRLVDLSLKGVPVADRDNYGRKFVRSNGWNYVCKYGRGKAYEMMSCYQGMLEYSQVARQKGLPVDNLEKAAIFAGENISSDEVDLAGGCASSEAWFHGAKKQHRPYTRLHEACVTTTWMRFCEKLLETTGNPKWADEIEKTFYNAYLGALRRDGGEFAAYTPMSGTRWRGMHHCYMHTDCCTANGPRGFLCFLKKFFVVQGGTAVFNFYSSALVEGRAADGRKVAFDMYSLYPRNGHVRIVSHTEGRLDLKFRIPAWSEATSVRLNGKPQPGVKRAEYFTISRDWKLGDVVELVFAMPVVAHRLDHHLAFTCGPVLLARDSRFNKGDLMSPLRGGSIKSGAKMNGFTPVRVPSSDIWIMYNAVLSNGTHPENPEASLPESVFFCDFASAGNSWERDDYYRTWFPEELYPHE